ncbi:MAG: SDR family oxidoreductase [Devosia nanyangense]|nr:SDR family oxidoreductase [Devosia nanyangense]
MTNVLILGASGQIARHVIGFLHDHPSIRATLFLRDAGKLGDLDVSGMRVIEGDVADRAALAEAMAGQDIVYANLAGPVDALARTIVEVMEETGVKRLIFITTLGIYDEVPGAFGAWNNAMIGEDIPPYRRAADLIEESGLDYTIVRPAWLTDADEVSYETTQKGEAFKGTEVSRRSVAAFVVSVLENPTLASRGSVGVDKPGTEGDKPAFY